jgi:hypothetical protein
MAAGTLPRPGTEYGPCIEECAHQGCAETRAMAEAACDICDDQIGHDRRFYRRDVIRIDGHGTRLSDTAGRPYVLVHASCVET